MGKPTKTLRFTVYLVVLSALGGCTLITDVDRGLIPTGSGGSGPDASVPDGGSTPELDAGK